MHTQAGMHVITQKSHVQLHTFCIVHSVLTFTELIISYDFVFLNSHAGTDQVSV